MPTTSPSPPHATVVKELSKNPHVKELHLIDGDFMKSTNFPFSELLGSEKMKLESLILAGCRMDTRQFESFAFALIEPEGYTFNIPPRLKSENLRSLYLRHSGGKGDHEFDLSYLSYIIPDTKIESIGFWDTKKKRLSGDSIGIIASSPNLRELDIRGCNLDDPSQVIGFVTALRSPNCALTTLVMTLHNQTTNLTHEMIAGAVNENTSLTKLILTDSHLGKGFHFKMRSPFQKLGVSTIT